MASDVQRSGIALKAEADAVCALCNNGILRIYSGSPIMIDQPAPNELILTEHEFERRAFPEADNTGRTTTNSITPDQSAKRDGKPGWFRAFRKDGSAVFQGTAGKGDFDLKLGVGMILQGAIVDIKTLTYQAKAKSNG